MVYINIIEDVISQNFKFYEEDGILKWEYVGNYNAIYDPDTSFITFTLDDEQQKIKFKIIEGQIYVHVPTGTIRQWGEFIVSKFDSNTSMNIFWPKTPTGSLLYHLWGFGFDNFNEKVLQLIDDLSPVTCSVERLNEYAKEFNFEVNDLTLTNINEIRAYILRHKYNTRILKTLNEVIKKIEINYNEELKQFLKNDEDNPIDDEILMKRLDDWENYKPCYKNEDNKFVPNELFYGIQWHDLSEKFYNYGKRKTIPTLY